MSRFAAMKDVLTRLLEEAKASLNSCPVCPVKGTCVFVTPAYEPGYCPHEYKLLHAYLAQRLRAHPPAGASSFARIVDEAQTYARRLREERPYDPSCPVISPGSVWPIAGVPGQATLEAYGT